MKSSSAAARLGHVLAFLVGCTLALPLSTPCRAADVDYTKERERLINIELRPSIKDNSVLDAMLKVPRHLLVPEPYRHLSYLNQPLPIGEGQTISQPYIVALMTETIAPRKELRVLEVGTGSGYQAAVLAELVSEVYTIEIVEPLAARAKKDLEKLGYKNVFVRAGDGYRGWPEKAPFDAVIITAAAPKIPQPLIDQLKEGGRMVLPLGESEQELMLGVKERGKLETKALIPVIFVPMTGEVRIGK